MTRIPSKGSQKGALLILADQHLVRMKSFQSYPYSEQVAVLPITQNSAATMVGQRKRDPIAKERIQIWSVHLPTKRLLDEKMNAITAMTQA